MAKSGTSESDVESDEKDENATDKALEVVDVNDSKSNNSVNIISKRVKVSTPASIVIESLVRSLCTIYEPNPEKGAILYKLICDKLFQMNLIDESYKMEEFEGMRIEYRKALQHVLASSIGGDRKTLAIRPAWPNEDSMNSHYAREFDEIEYIAGGGFGRVFRVKHKLDGTEYAIKKIPIRAEGIKAVRNYLSEVKTFASLNHSNIVQYKAAWLELGAPSNNHLMIDSETESFTDETKTHIDEDYIYHKDEALSFSDHKDEDTSDFEVNFEYSVNASITAKQTTKTSKREKRSSISEGGNAICRLDMKEIKELKMQHRAQAKWATLYIQMSLCQSTLRQWLEMRNDAELIDEDKALVTVTGRLRSATINEVLKQLLKGLEYIHSKGIVHHDIKPSNIFVELEPGHLLVQLGDFGLACPLQSVRHSLAFGTKLYAAPEQLAGKCDPKSDMYSLGIVLYELVEAFRTDMERIQNINELRRGNLPARIHIQYPQLAQIICELMSKDPRSRPNASTLLKSVMRSIDDTYIKELECKLAEKDEEIGRLRELLKTAGATSI